MFVRSLVLLLSTLSFAAAWPIFFYESENCKHHPVFTLHFPPPPNVCLDFEHFDVRSYFGGTRDDVQKVLLYDDIKACDRDAAHCAYANHTINDNTTLCHTFPGYSHIPRAFVFIEETLGPIPNKTENAPCDAFIVQHQK